MQWKSYESIELENTKNIETITIYRGTLIKFMFSNHIGILMENVYLDLWRYSNPVEIYVNNEIVFISREKMKYYL